MRKIFYLKGQDVSQFNNYAELIIELAEDCLRPGAHPEKLNVTGLELYSVRFNQAARLIYSVIKEDGPYKNSIVLCAATDDHNYNAVIRSLTTPCKNLRGILPYAQQSQEPTEIDVPLDQSGYAQMHFYGKNCIEFNPTQNEVVHATLPLVCHGAPGTGKTLIGVKIAIDYIKNAVLEEDVTGNITTLRALFLSPTSTLAEETKNNYLAACQFEGIDERRVALAEFLPYAVFFKERTNEGLRIPPGVETGFADFKHWYHQRASHKKTNIHEKSLSAENYWAAFRICSLYSNFNQYNALGIHQCDLPSEVRETIYTTYCGYKNHCEETQKYSSWINPYSCNEFGLVILDEAHNQSGCTVLSAYQSAKDGNFIALVGDHQKTGNHWNQYGRGFTTPDLLTLLIHQDQRYKFKINTHILSKTHRNSEAVITLINLIIEWKQTLGLNTLFKNSDKYLDGHNGKAGKTGMIIADAAALSDLKVQFSGLPSVAIIVPEIDLTEAKKRWPTNIVLSADGALGLEFPYIITEGLLADKQGSLTIGKLLNNVSKEASQAGHRAKELVNEETMQQESWLSNLITAYSRAQEDVYIVEKDLPKHTAHTVFQALQKICGQPEAPIKTLAPVASASNLTPLYEQWLQTALMLLQENTPEMDAEAMRVMNENLPDKQCTIYLRFLAKYQENQQGRIIHTPKPVSLPKTISAVTTIPPETTVLQITSKEAPQVIKKSTPPPALSQEQSYAKLLLDNFSEDHLLNAVADCNVITLFNCEVRSARGKTKRLFESLTSIENQTTFIHCWVNNPEVFRQKTINITGFEQMLPKSCSKKLESFFKNLKTIQAHLKQNSAIINLNTLIFSAVKNENINVLEVLHKAHINPNQVIDKGLTTTLVASRLGKIDVIKYLHKIKVDLNQANDIGFTPAHAAAERGRIDILRYLHDKAGVDLNPGNKTGFTPAHLAAQGGHLAILMYLHKEAGLQLNQTETEEGWVPAHAAAEFGNIDVIKFLHKEARVNLNQSNKNGFTPAHLAAQSGKVKVIRYLHKEADITLNQMDMEGRTPSHLAAEFGNIDVIKYLHKEAGVDLNQGNHQGLTPAHLAAQSGHLEILKYLYDEAHIKNLNQGNTEDLTPMHLAAEYGQIGILKYLHNEVGIDLNQSNIYGFRPIHLAAQSGHLDVITYLCDEAHINNLNPGNIEGTTPTHLAAEYGQIDILQYFHNKIDLRLNPSNNKGFTLAHFATRGGHIHVIKYLHKAVHVDFNQVSLSGITVMHTAAKEGQVEILQYLHNEMHIDLNQSDNKGLTLAHVAAQSGHLEVLRYLYSMQINLNQPEKMAGWVPAHSAAESGNIDVIKYLHKEAHIHLNQSSNTGFTLAHIAAQGGYLEILRYLHDETDIDLKQSDIEGVTPAHIAAECGKTDVLTYLHNETTMDLNQNTINGFTPAHFAIQNGHIDVLKYFHKLGIDFTQSDKNNFTLTHFAARFGHINVLKYFHDELKIDLTQSTNTGFAPVHAAAQHGHVDVLKYLHELKIDLTQSTSTGFTPVYFATQYGHINVLKYFHELKINLTQNNVHGLTPVHTAAQVGHVHILEYLYREIGVNLNQSDNSGFTPVYFAAQGGHLEVLRYLHDEAKIDLTQNNIDGLTPMHSAAQAGHVHILEYLYTEFGINLNQSDKEGFTPAHLAAQYGHINVLIYLHNEANIELNQKNNEGCTPLFIATESGHLNTVKYLLRWKSDNHDALYLADVECKQLASDYDESVQKMMDQKIAERLRLGDNLKKIKLLPLDIAEVIGHKDIEVLLREHAAPELSMATLLIQNSSLFNQCSHSVVTSTTGKKYMTEDVAAEIDADDIDLLNEIRVI